MNLEFNEHSDTYENLWKDLIENGEQPCDIRIDGVGLFTNAKVTRDNEGSFTITYDEYIEG